MKDILLDFFDKHSIKLYHTIYSGKIPGLDVGNLYFPKENHIINFVQKISSNKPLYVEFILFFPLQNMGLSYYNLFNLKQSVLNYNFTLIHESDNIEIKIYNNILFFKWVILHRTFSMKYNEEIDFPFDLLNRIKLLTLSFINEEDQEQDFHSYIIKRMKFYRFI